MDQRWADELADCIETMISCSERGEDGYMIDEVEFHKAKDRLREILATLVRA